MKDYRGIISANAARLRELNAEIDRTFKAQPHGPEHHAACAAFHSQSDALSFPGGLETSLANLKAGDPNVVDIAVQYLEVDLIANIVSGAMGSSRPTGLEWESGLMFEC